MNKPNIKFQNQSIQIAGLLLWRMGLLLAGSTGVYRVARFLLQFVELPIQLEIGLGLVFSGAVFFMASLILERIVDAKTEGDLRA